MGQLKTELDNDRGQGIQNDIPGENAKLSDTDRFGGGNVGVGGDGQGDSVNQPCQPGGVNRCDCNQDRYESRAHDRCQKKRDEHARKCHGGIHNTHEHRACRRVVA